MRVRIVAADRGEARLYDVLRADSKLQLVGHLTDPKAHLHNRDFNSDRPGRVFDHAPASGQRRGAVSHHGTESEESPKQHEAQLFARRIAEELAAAQRRGEFDRLVLMAGPAFIGELRAAIPKTLHDTIVAEINKDLLHQGESAISAHLSPDMFFT